MRIFCSDTLCDAGNDATPLWQTSFLLACLCALFAFGVAPLAAQNAMQSAPQNAVVRGKILDRQTQKPLAGAVITLVPDEEAKMNEFVYVFQGARASMSMIAGDAPKETRAGAVAGRDGVFEIRNVRPGTYKATARYIGYKKFTQTFRLEISATAELRAELAPDAQGIEEIVVTGVASRTAKETAEVSVGRVDMASLTDKVFFSSPLQGLIGKVPGMFLQFSNGSLGAGVRINIRSSASLLGGQPTIFIDGVRSTGVDYHTYSSLQLDEITPLATLAADDIETIEVLKGPVASSLYGTSGQNGVIMISTKRGAQRVGDRNAERDEDFFRLDYRFTEGVQEPHRGLSEELTLNAANANRIFRAAPTAQHQISLQGSIGSRSAYYFSLVQRNETGIVPGNEARLTSLRANVDLHPFNGLHLKLSSALSFRNFDLPLPNEGGGVFYSWLRNTLAGNPSSGLRFFLADSLSISKIENTIDITHSLGSMDISYIPLWLPGLKIRAMGAIENVRSRAVRYLPPGYPYSVLPDAEPSGGFRLIKNFAPVRYNIDAHISYTGDITDDVRVAVIAGAQAYSNRFVLDNMQSANFISPALRAIQTGTNNAVTQSNFVTEIDESFREAGVFLRAEAEYRQTLFFSAGVRNDYASSLGALSLGVFYPQASFAARLDKMNILPATVNLFKIRGGYGESGKLPTARQSAIFWKVFSAPGTSLTGSTGRQLFLESPAGNPAIAPERIQEFELGADVEINDRFGAEITGFYQFSRDAILEALPPASLGFSRTAENSGRLRGWGAEAQVYGMLIDSPNLTLHCNLNASYADNIVDSLGRNELYQSEKSFFVGVNQSVFTEPSNYLHVGYRRGLFMDRPVVAPRFRADGYYDWERGPAQDSVLRPLGSSVPLAIASFSWTLTLFQEISLYGMVDAGVGRYILNGTRQQAAATGSNAAFNALATRLGLAFGQSGDIGLGILPTSGEPVLTPNTAEYKAAAEEFMKMDTRYGVVANYLERGDWIRFRELSLRWNALPFLRSTFAFSNQIRAFSLGVSARNLALWTTYSGADTEINSPANIPSRTIAQSSDIWSVMQSRAVYLQCELGF
jgi:TonB-dependent SusC/RagA subfamily outer membrane receptor